ncbi:beta-1,3-galactosyltransferase 1-like [Ylistrum balloti]|uniref:beta-1,3-galactosyltransferase 1-like n=1 Tax=Ylistrum balloti TaxID=509963 RepID=UPI002905AD13|nr:beta-1,3-galactosyltransferase 1-like [Ylistrum balloti]
MKQIDIRNISKKQTCTDTLMKPSENDTLQLNLTSEPESPYYMASIHPLHIDLNNLVRARMLKGSPIPVPPINPHPYTYLIRPPDCHYKTTDNITIVILVKSYVKHTIQRYAIRETWGRANTYPNVKIAFLLAAVKNFQRYVENEASLYNDIIQENFTDNYWNNTLKTIMAFNWVTEFCSEAKIIIFVDDDHLLHMENVLSFLRSLSADTLNKLYAGYLIKNARVNRGHNSSIIPLSEYPYPKWPPYLRGGLFIMAMDIAQLFATAFPYVKSLPVDDVYLGIVAFKLNLTIAHDRRFTQKRERIKRFKSTHFSFNDYKTRETLIAAWGTISLRETHTQLIRQVHYKDKLHQTTSGRDVSGKQLKQVT